MKPKSIPKFVEDNAVVLKARYLAWIYDLGEKRIDGRRLVDHLELRPSFSYWWMTAIAQKSTYVGPPHITDVIRLMAFDAWATERTLSRVVLASSNQPLAECMRSWCASSGVGFDWRCSPKQSVHVSLVSDITQVESDFAANPSRQSASVTAALPAPSPSASSHG